MSFERGLVVRSLSGRDKGRFFAVLSAEETQAVIADGNLRGLDRPKRKNLRHLAKTNTILSAQALTSDEQLAAALASFEGKALGLNEGGQELV
ncbi:MAG: KOW domain-containing RNA-binding protein [Oscillospiraceae bacterium]|nr:KOW domain-containing RNA-binding protein [Oscillospiraceae bacterium]